MKVDLSDNLSELDGDAAGSDSRDLKVNIQRLAFHLFFSLWSSDFHLF